MSDLHVKTWLGFEGKPRSEFLLVVILLLSCVWLLCGPRDCSLPGSFLHGISEARILEWVAISCSKVSAQPRDQTRVSCISCIGRQVPHPMRHLGNTRNFFIQLNIKLRNFYVVRFTCSLVCWVFILVFFLHYDWGPLAENKNLSKSLNLEEVATELQLCSIITLNQQHHMIDSWEPGEI